MKFISWFVSLALHGLIFCVGEFSIQQPIVGIVRGQNGIEVHLAAAMNKPSAPASVSCPTPPPVPAALPQSSPTLHRLPDPTPTAAPSSQTLPPPLTRKATGRRSNSASRHMGKDAVSSLAGAVVDREPDYLSNPAPEYPEAARQQQQQGLVILDVIVGMDGRSEAVKISSGSGYYLLDEAARKAVRTYRFRPATIEGVKVRSHVRVPIRFHLNNSD